MTKKKTRRETLSNSLRRAVRQAGRPQYQIARAARIDPAQLSRFLNGQSNLSLATAERLARHLGLMLVPVHPTPKST